MKKSRSNKYLIFGLGFIIAGSLLRMLDDRFQFLIFPGVIIIIASIYKNYVNEGKHLSEK